VIRFDDVSVTYRGGVQALRNVDLRVDDGEFVVVVGLSGAGKSTLLRALNGLVPATSGSITIDGTEVVGAGAAELRVIRSRIGMIFQTFNLVHRTSVLNNVLMGRLSAVPAWRSTLGLWPSAEREAALQALERVGIVEKAYVRASNLSGGQQQRVGIGRSLAVEPDVWFLDEPFSALDALIRRDMQDEFLRLQSTLQKTIIFITHDFDEAIRLADRIAIMRDGVIDQLGTAEELITNPGSDYVAAFTKNVSRAKLLRVHTLMGSASDDAEGEVDGRVFVASVASQILSSTVPLRVVEDGEVVGSITAAQVNEALFESE